MAPAIGSGFSSGIPSIPGDPGTLYTSARSLGAQAGAIRDWGYQLRGIAAALTGLTWSGQGQLSFAAWMSVLVDCHLLAAQSLNETSAALSCYAPVLAECQAQVRAAQAELAEAQAAAASAMARLSSAPLPPHDPAAAAQRAYAEAAVQDQLRVELEAAKSKGQAAWDNYDAAALRAAAQVAAATPLWSEVQKRLAALGDTASSGSASAAALAQPSLTVSAQAAARATSRTYADLELDNAPDGGGWGPAGGTTFSGGGGPGSGDASGSTTGPGPTSSNSSDDDDDPRIPRGFRDPNEFEKFCEKLTEGLKEAGYKDTKAAFQGSSVTGTRFGTDEEFDEHSDYDIALGGRDIFDKAKDRGIRLRGGGTRTEPLELKNLKQLGLAKLQEDLSGFAGRDVHFMIFRSIDDALARSASIPVPGS